MTTVYIEKRPHEIEGRWWSVDEERYYRMTFCFLNDAIKWANRVDDNVKIVVHE